MISVSPQPPSPQPQNTPTTPQDQPIPFSLATHNGIITIHNTRTNNHRTFRIHTHPQDSSYFPGRRTVGLLVGPDNSIGSGDWLDFGVVAEDEHWKRAQCNTLQNNRIVLFKKFRSDDGGGKFYKQAAHMLERPDYFMRGGVCEYMVQGRCRRCNRVLSTPESVRSGVGPICGGREGGK